MNGQTTTPVSQNTPPAKGPVILLIEDDSLLSRMYKAKFNMEGFQVIVADDGEKGLKIATEQKVDFVILDIMMPKISGLDLLATLREHPQGKNLAVIVLTNLAQEEKTQKAMSLGAKEFLIKANVTPGQVVNKVKQYLTRPQKTA